LVFAPKDLYRLQREWLAEDLKSGWNFFNSLKNQYAKWFDKRELKRNCNYIFEEIRNPVFIFGNVLVCVKSEN
jgi:uncharacterized protein YktA (UPF0223 family)